MTKVQEARRLIRYWNILHNGPFRVCMTQKLLDPEANRCWICTLDPVNWMVPFEMRECDAQFNEVKSASRWLLRRARRLLRGTEYEVVDDEDK